MAIQRSLRVLLAGLAFGSGSLAATATAISLSASANPINYGASLSIAATVAPASATGKVTFYDDTTVLGTAPLVSGKAAISSIALASGTRKLRAFYAGDTSNSSGTSAVLPQTVKAIPGTGFTIVNTLHDAGATAAFVLAADFNGDGKADVAVANSDSNDVSVLLGKGNGTFQTAVGYPAGTRPAALAAADFNGDGRLDLAVANGLSGDISILLGKGDGTFQAPVNYLVGMGPRAVAAGDFDADGKADLITANLGGKSISVLLGKGDGTFAPAVRFDAGDAAVALAVADFNGDSKLDVAVIGGAAGVRILAGKGDGSFGAPATYTADGFAIVTADFNGDGKPDLATAGFAVEESLGNGDGSFQPILTYEAPTATLFHLAVADFNGDGRADIISANGPDNNLTVLLAAPFAITGVSNAAGGGLTAQSGSWVAIYGSGLSLTTRMWMRPTFRAIACRCRWKA